MKPVGESSVPKGRGRSFSRHEQVHKDLRRPRTDLAVNSNNAEPGPVAEGSTSNLSADAKEFYPKNYQSQQFEDSVSYDSSLQSEEAGPEEGGSSYDSSFNSVCETKQEEFATDGFFELMHHLTLNPGNFDDLVAPLVDIFYLWLGNADTVSSIVTAVVEQSIMEPNFRYNGARLCHFLDSEFSTEERTFRNSLLNRCREEHVQISKYINTDPGRLHGYVLFMAELFMQLECVKGHRGRIAILGTALLEALSLLLEHFTPGNIKCVCQVLKLTGQPLDVQDPVNMNKIMECLLHLLNNVVLEPNVHRLISSVIELRHVGWGDASNCTPHTSTSQFYNPCPQNGPVFYGPDGQIMTPEEREFLQESVDQIPDHEEYDDYGEGVDIVLEPDDEIDEEMHAAYEQFLEMNKTQSNDLNSTHSECSG